MPFTPLSPFPEPPASPPPEPSSGMTGQPQRSSLNLPNFKLPRSSQPHWGQPSFSLSPQSAPLPPPAPLPPEPRPNPFAPKPYEPDLPRFRPVPLSGSRVSAANPLRKHQNPVHSTPKLRSVPLRKQPSRRKSSPEHSHTATASPFSMTTSSRPSRNSRRRSSKTHGETLSLRNDRPNQAIPSSPGIGSEQSEKMGSDMREPGRSRSRSKRLPLPILYGIRLLILGVGLGVIAGTLLAALDPNYQLAAETEQTNGNENTLGNKVSKILPVSDRNALVLNSDMTDLSQQLQKLANAQPDLVAGSFVVDLDTGDYSQLNGERSFATASMIKVHILVAFFQDVDAGLIDLTEQLTMREDLVAPHAGEMQYLPVGTQFTALETAQEMIRISDNTATNMLIDRLGGMAALNQRFKQWGLKQTALNDWLPDLEGTNVSTPKDLVTLLSMVEQGQLVSLRSRDRLLAIMRTPITDTLLPQGLGEGATIAHKTGDIGTLVGDVGLIDMPSGKRYLAAMMVERPFNDNRAQELIRQMSRASYNYLEKLPVPEDQPDTNKPDTSKPAGILTQQGQIVSPASVSVNSPR